MPFVQVLGHTPEALKERKLLWSQKASIARAAGGCLKQGGWAPKNSAWDAQTMKRDVGIAASLVGVEKHQQQQSKEGRGLKSEKHKKERERGHQMTGIDGFCVNSTWLELSHGGHCVGLI